MIVRVELPPSQPGLRSVFDSTPSSLTIATTPAIPDYRMTIAPSPVRPEEAKRPEPNVSSAKKKWSLFGKVLSFSPSSPGPGAANQEDRFDQVRRDTAASRITRSGPMTPPKHDPPTPGSDTDSVGSSPTFDMAQYVFRFALHNVPHQMHIRDRIITRPRLPAPAQARVSARLSAERRSDSPPPVRPGLPPPERRFSGAILSGLVNDAKNADPEIGPDSQESRSSMAISVNDFEVENTPLREIFGDREPRPDERDHRSVIRPEEPLGQAVTTSKYAGRALAEWCIVVNECNSFVDRRRDEGVLGLKEVEVPLLGVETLRKMG
jgi:hypothetical protein